MRTTAAARNCCPFIGVAAEEFTSSFCVLPSSFPCASFQTNRSNRRLRGRCIDARFDRPRPEAGSISGLFASIQPGCTKQLARYQRQCPHDRRRNRTLQKRRACGTRAFAAPTTHRDDSRSRDCYSAPSRSSPLAHAIVDARVRDCRDSHFLILPSAFELVFRSTRTHRGRDRAG